MTAPGFDVFGGDAARAFIRELREASPTTVGDSISAALRAVGQAETTLTQTQVERALAALALLLSSFDPAVLRGAGGDDFRSWFADLEVELNPARRQIAGAAVDRILLPAENAWYAELSEPGGRGPTLVDVHRLRDLLTDSAAQE